MRSARSVGVTLVLLYCSVLTTISSAQFSGSAGIGVATFRNAEGTDPSSGDLAVTPNLQIDYTIKFSPIASLRPGIGVQYDLYLEKVERSYYTISPELVFKTYLSNQDAIREEAKSNAAAALVDSSHQDIGILLSALADTTLELRTGIGRTTLSKAAIDDLEADIAATLLAYVGLMEEMGLTQSFKEVLLEELATTKERIAQLGVPKSELNTFNRTVDALTKKLTSITAENDLALSPSVQAESGVLFPEAEPNASLISLITTGSGLEHFSSSRFYPKYYQGSVYATTYASKLTMPLYIDLKQYRADYEAYSYTAYRLQPRFDFYPSTKVAIGIDYMFERSQFPESNLYTFNEHALRIDSRIEFFSWLCAIPEIGLGRRHYPNPMTITVALRDFRRTFTAPSNYPRFSSGLALISFPTDWLSVGVSARMTRGLSDSVFYLGGISSQQITNSSYYGLASDESYIYEVTAFTGAVSAMLPADIELGLDVVAESRIYPAPPSIPGIARTIRTDDVFWVGGSLSKYFLFTREPLGFIESLYPRITLTYTDLASNLTDFSYSDLSFTAGFSLGF